MKYFIVLFLICIGAVRAQELTVPVKLLSNFKSGPENYIGTDALGAIYTVHDNELHKYTEGITLKYKAVALGEIYKVDLQNPLQIVLFYRKFNTVVLLDNQLNETTRVNFSNIPEPIIAEAAGLAAQNRLWVYDINSQRLGLYGLNPNTFIPITPPFTDSIKYYQNDYNYFYWIDTTGKCFASNLFGKVTFLGQVGDYEQVQVVSPTQALVKKDNALYLYNLQAKTRKRVGVVEKSFQSFNYSGQILSIFTGAEINTYQITLSE